MLNGIRSTKAGEGLGAYLVSLGRLSEAALERAERVSGETGDRLESVLTRLGLIAEGDLAEAFSGFLGLPLASEADFPEAPVLEGLLSRRFLRDSRLIPISDDSQGIGVAMVNPLDRYAIEAICFATGKSARLVVALPADLDAAFDRLYGEGKTAISEIMEESNDRQDDSGADDVERLRDSASEAPVIRLVNILIMRAVEAGASDIHLEPMEDRLCVRYRIDGVLRDVESPPQRFRSAVISRIKVMAKLNIAERRLAQDGRIRLAVRGREVDFRVSTTPTILGESVVLRILDRSNNDFDFTILGFEGPQLTRFRSILNRPHGIVLVTGPTGSGKTTTLYAALKELNTRDRKILTIEDPVEYQIAGVNQVQVKPQIGLTFANALRSFLRQDPDIMMIGEIRDAETAQIAVQAALTGHLILSTLHTNDAAGAITRLLDMGVEEYLLTSTINGLLAQRLIRTLCPLCREPYAPLPELVNQLGLDQLAEAGPSLTLFRSTGCDHCGGTGYRGRSSIIELMPVSDRIRQLILSRAEVGAIREAAVADGMTTMQRHGLAKAVAGMTTVEEVLRVTCEA